MRLEPVLLVAQDPPPTPPATRRAFVFGAAVFATGLSLGGACGYAIGARRVEGDAAAPVNGQEELKPSGDADLDELRRLAVKAPIEELVKHDMLFMRSAAIVYKNDDVLWRGIRRLAERVCDRADYPNRRASAGVILQAIEGAPAERRKSFADILADLRLAK